MEIKGSNNGRVTVITGSSKDTEKGIAMEFAKAGYSVVLNARTGEKLERSQSKTVSRLYRYPEIYHRNMFVFLW